MHVVVLNIKRAESKYSRNIQQPFKLIHGKINPLLKSPFIKDVFFVMPIYLLTNGMYLNDDLVNTVILKGRCQLINFIDPDPIYVEYAGPMLCFYRIMPQNRKW